MRSWSFSCRTAEQIVDAFTQAADIFIKGTFGKDRKFSLSESVA